MIAIEYKRLSEFQTLAVCWQLMEQGSEMSYYQTFDWHSSILSSIPKDNRFHEARFVILKEDGAVKMIAPIWVVKRRYLKVNEAGIFMLGRSGWSDYLNFIYSDANSSHVIAILNDISKNYGISSFYFEDIPQESLLYKTITSKFKVNYSHCTTCLRIQVPPTIGDYCELLSKHSKQNIRTANNRLIKDGLSIEYCFDDVDIDKKTCTLIRKERLYQKMENENHFNSLKVKLFNLLRIKFKYKLPFYADKNSHIMSAYINNEVAAFFSYGIDVPHKKIVIMAAGIAEKYSWYSPGLLLAYNFILIQIQQKEVDVIDFTRGNERYKYSLGGVEHYNGTIKFSI